MADRNETKNNDETSINENDEDRIETLFKLQTENLRVAGKALENFTKDNHKRKSLRIYYSTKLAAFGQIVDDFQRNHRELIKLVPTSEMQSYPYFKKEHLTLFEDAQIDYITTLQSEFEAKFPETERPHPEPKAEHLPSNVSLPPISVPRFSGTPTEWKAFHDIFKSIIHNNTKLPGSHKIQYLASALSGDAKNLIAGYDLCDEDYPKAWKTLCEIYNDKPSMFMQLMNKFASLESTTKEHPETLRGLMKDAAACLKSLESVGVDSKKADPVLTYFLIRKLPPSTVAYWEESRNRTELPSFEQLQICIEKRIRVVSAIASAQWSTKSSASGEQRAEINPSYPKG